MDSGWKWPKYVWPGDLGNSAGPRTLLNGTGRLCRVPQRYKAVRAVAHGVSEAGVPGRP